MNLVKTKKTINSNGISERLTKRCKLKDIHLFTTKMLALKTIKWLTKIDSSHYGKKHLKKMLKFLRKEHPNFNTNKVKWNKQWNLTFFAINVFYPMLTRNSSSH